jgi:putative membrane protein
MKALNRKNLCKKIAVFSGIAGISSLIAVPVIAELNPQPNGFKQSGDRVFELAQSPSDSPATTPNNNNPGRSPNTPITPRNDRNPGRSPSTPDTPSNNNPGGSPNNPGGEDSPNSLSSTDRNFVLQAARNNMLEIELGRLAVQRGASDAVKQHGQKMVKEHSEANQELMQLAMQKGIELSPTEMSSQSTALRQQLSGLSGASFDAAYKQAMLASHNQAIALFQAQSRQGQDPELKAWATKMLPNLQAHLQMVNRMAGNTRQQ